MKLETAINTKFATQTSEDKKLTVFLTVFIFFSFCDYVYFSFPTKEEEKVILKSTNPEQYEDLVVECKVISNC